MSRPRNTKKPRWVCREAPGVGYIEERGGKARLRITYRGVYIRETLPFAFIPENRQRCEALLWERIKQVLYPELKPPQDQLRAAIQLPTAEVTLESIQRAHKAYSEEVAERPWSKAIKQMFRRAANKYFASIDVSAAIDYAELRRQLLIRHKELRGELADQTRQKYFDYIRQIFRFAVEKRLLPGDPFADVQRPDVEDVEDVETVPFEYLGQVIEFFRNLATEEDRLPLRKNQKTARSWELIFRLLRGTAMRPVEVIRLKPEDVDLQSGFRIDGKRSREHKPKPRKFPLRLSEAAKGTAVGEWIEEVRETLEAALRLGGFRGGYIFPPHHTQQINEAWHRACQSLGINAEGLPVKVIRPTVIEHWEAVLGVDWLVSCDLAGHNPAVRYKYYRRKQRAEAISKSLSRTAEGRQTAIDSPLVPNSVDGGEFRAK